MTSRAVQRILIIGAGFEGWLTAAKLARAFDTRAVDVAVCAAAGASAWDRLYTIQPWHPQDSLRAIGINDLLLVQYHEALYSLGADLSLPCAMPNGSVWPYGPVGIEYSGIAFHHHWTCEQAHARAFFDYSPATRAIQRAAFAPPAPRNAIGTLQHEIARHVDIDGVTATLRQTALDAGVERWPGTFETADYAQESRRIAGITVNGEQRSADLYIDCSGPLRVLSGRAKSWTQATGAAPLSVRTDLRPHTAPHTPCHSVQGDESGWRVVVPLQTQDVVLKLATDGGNGRLLTPGRSQRLWQDNHVAIGFSGWHTLPILPLQMLLLTHCIDRLIALMPGVDCAPGETLEFNQLMARDIDEALALQLLLEHARTQGKLPGSGDSIGNQSLDERIALFRKRGWVVDTDGALIDANDWIKTMMLLGIHPQQADAMTGRMSQEQRRQMLDNLDKHIAMVVDQFPTLHNYMLAAIAAGDTASGQKDRS
ncbi:MAG: tryptophan 7-halogenase [Pseudomonadota bacterium]